MELSVQYVRQVSTVQEAIILVSIVTLHVANVRHHQLSVLSVQWTINLREVGLPVRPVVLGFSVRLEILPAVLVMFPALAVQGRPPLASTAISTISCLVVGLPAPSALRGPSPLREIHPARHVTPLVPLALRLRPPASPATSTTSPRGQGRPARPASWGLSPRSETPPALPATCPAMAAMRLPPRARTAQ